MAEPSELQAKEAAVARWEESWASSGGFDPDLDNPVEQIQADVNGVARSRQRDSQGRYVANGQQAHQHNGTVVKLARDLGFSQEEIDRTSPEVLEDRTYHLQRERMQQAQEWRKVAGNGVHPTQQASQPIVQEPEPEIDLSQFDPELVRFIKKQEAEISKLKAERQQERQQQVQSQRDQSLDDLFKRINRPDLFGKGSVKDVWGTADLDRRVAVVNKMATIERGTEAEKAQEAIKRLFGTKEPEANGRSLYDRHEQERSRREPEDDDGLERRRGDWEEGAYAQPTHRKPGPARPEIRAARVWRDGLRNTDLAIDDGQDDSP